MLGCCTAKTPRGSAASPQHSNGVAGRGEEVGEPARLVEPVVERDDEGDLRERLGEAERAGGVVDGVRAGHEERRDPARAHVGDERLERRRAAVGGSAPAPSSSRAAANASRLRFRSRTAVSSARPEADSLAEPPATTTARPRAATSSFASADSASGFTPVRPATAGIVNGASACASSASAASGPSCRATTSSCRSAVATAASWESRTRRRWSAFAPGEGQATLELDEAAHADAVSRLGRAAPGEVGLEAVLGPVEELRAEARRPGPPCRAAAAEGGRRRRRLSTRGPRRLARSARTRRAAGPSAP